MTSSFLYLLLFLRHFFRSFPQLFDQLVFRGEKPKVAVLTRCSRLETRSVHQLGGSFIIKKAFDLIFPRRGHLAAGRKSAIAFLFKVRFHPNAHGSIAVELLYLESFKLESIRVRHRPLNRFNGSVKERAPSDWCVLRPNDPPDLRAIKSEFVDRFKIYRSVCI